MKIYFDHEKLDAYQASIRFCGWVGELINKVSGKAAAKDQLDRASTSVPLNIAEGNAKFSHADRSRFFEIARGSTVESAACLDVLRVRNLISDDDVVAGKEQLVGITQMLVGLLRKFSSRAGVLREEPASDANTDYEHEHDYE